jgi:O-antigen/teichoic acid export membrane protein
MVGIAILWRGGGLIAVSGVFLVGGLVGIAWSSYWMYRSLVRPRLTVDISRWRTLLRKGLPFGLAITLFYALLRLDAILLSFLRGGDNTDVGNYGAAYRLIEATMFVSWAFGSAVFPWLSRHDPSQSVPLNRAYELAIKALVATLLPVSALFAVYAKPIIALLYGDAYHGAVVPLQLLAAMTVLFGLNTFMATLMLARGKALEFAAPAGVVIVQNVIFNIVLIPPYGANAAALNAVISGALLVGWTLHRAGRLFGSISIVRVALAPMLASALLGGVALATGQSLTIPALAAATVTYAASLVALERVLFADDFRFYAALIAYRRKLGSPGIPQE